MLPKQYAHGMMPVTPQVRADINKLNEHARRLNLAVMPATFASWQIRDIETDAVEMDSGLHKCNSFNRNFYNGLVHIFTGQDDGYTTTEFGEGIINVALKNASGTEVLQGIASAVGNISKPTAAGAGIMASFVNPAQPTFSTLYGGRYSNVTGIMLEDALIEENFDTLDYSLILHGIAEGQLSHIAPTVIATKNYNPETKTYTTYIKRIFQNNSPSDVTIYSSVVSMQTLSYAPVIYERSNFPEPVVLAAGKLIEVTYAIEFIYPEPEVAAPYSVEYTSTTATEPTTVEFETVDAMTAWVTANKATLVTVKMSNTVVPDTEYSFSQLFKGSTELLSLNMEKYDATNLTDVSELCMQCSNLNTFVAPFNFKPFLLRAMFRATDMQTINLTSIDLSEATSLQHAFANNPALISLTLGGILATEQVSLESLASNNPKLQTIDLSALTLPSNTTYININYMFENSSNEVVGDVTAYARIQTDADLYNTSGFKPSNITFTVKP